MRPPSSSSANCSADRRSRHGRTLGRSAHASDGLRRLCTAADAAPPAPSRSPSRGVKKCRRRRPRAAPDPQRVYSSDDDGVTPAQPIRQEVPRVPMQIANQTRERGILDVTIDEQGRVIAAAIRVGLHPIYDSQILWPPRNGAISRRR